MTKPFSNLATHDEEYERGLGTDALLLVKGTVRTCPNVSVAPSQQNNVSFSNIHRSVLVPPSSPQDVSLRRSLKPLLKRLR